MGDSPNLMDFIFPNYRYLIYFSNNLSYYVVSTIFMENAPQKRTKTIEKWIDIFHHSFLFNDYYTVSHIENGLNNFNMLK